MKIIITEINSCKECPHCRIQRTPTEDRFKMVMDWFCCKELRLIGIKKEGDNDPQIPDWCPLETINENIKPVAEEKILGLPVILCDAGEITDSTILTTRDENGILKMFNLPENAEGAMEFFLNDLFKDKDETIATLKKALEFYASKRHIPVEGSFLIENGMTAITALDKCFGSGE